MKEEFKESEIGLIPKEWDYKRLDEVFHIARGGSPRPIKDFITEAFSGTYLGWGFLVTAIVLLVLGRLKNKEEDEHTRVEQDILLQSFY